MRHSLTHYVCALLVLCGFAPLASAQVVENDLRLVADQSGAPPNVMILFDTSGSMRHIIWHEDFNPKLLYPNPSCSTSLSVSSKSGTSGQCPGSGFSGGACPDNDANWRYSGETLRCPVSSFPAGCAAWSFSDPTFTAESCFVSGSDIFFRLPSLNSVETWWSRNYLRFLLRQMQTASALPADMPDERRTDGGKRVIEELIESVNPDDASALGYDERVRFGIARLDGNNRGGYVTQAISDGNKDAVITALNSLPADGGTPVSEAFVDVGRYFVGDLDPLGAYPAYDRRTDGVSDAAAAPDSPLDPSVLCRGNFVIIISDGEPSEDTHGHLLSQYTGTFGSVNSNSLSTVADYLFENDLVDDTLMPGLQNIITYTVGFALDTPLLRNTALNGDGAYFSVSTTDQLAETLTTAVEEIILRNATFTAASVPTSRSVFGDGFYTAFFDPRPAGELYRGHLQAYRIDENFDIVGDDGANALDPITGEFLEPRDTFFWDAAETLADPLNVRRLFFTVAATGTATAFEPANLSAADLGVTAAELTLYPNDTAVPFASEEALADAIVNYVRGQDAFDTDRDTDTGELRETVLGDIFHSNPQLVGQAPLLLAAEEGYGPIGDPSAFLELYARREKILYAGANDGMLHAFGAGVFQNGDNPVTPTVTEAGYYTVGDGIERFGYVPGFLLGELKRLPLAGAKPYFVDGQITVADAWFPSSSSDVDKDTREWTTSLVTGMRNGGRGYLALDITNPQALSPTDDHGPYPKLLWEFNDPSEPLGRSWSKAVVTRVKLKGSFSQDFCGTDDGDGADGVVAGNCRERWVAIFGGGYLEQADPNIPDQFLTDPSDPAWEDASKAIFMVAMDTGEVLARAAYDATDSELANMTLAFPSEPAVLDLDFDGFADLVYIGDLGGQMWKWDISAVGQVSGATGLVPLTTWPVGRFFTAPVASNGHRRNFFFAPSASLVDGKLVLAFGTGERTNLEYETTGTDDVNHFYVIRDDVPTGAGAFTDLPYDISDLTELTDLDNDTNPNDQGFYLVGQEDEKFVSDSIVFGGFVITASYTPDLGAATTSGGECEARGDATLYIFTISDGTGYFEGSGDPNQARRLVVGSGLPTSPSITIVSGNMSKVVLQTSDGRVIKLDGPPSTVQPVDLIYWRQAL